MVLVAKKPPMPRKHSVANQTSVIKIRIPIIKEQVKQKT